MRCNAPAAVQFVPKVWATVLSMETTLCREVELKGAADLFKADRHC
jgi:hypothetical protein